MSDQRRLAAILDLGHELEALWLSASPERGTKLVALIDLIAALSNAESEDLRRLAIHSRNLTPEMSARHLAGILVPFERLHGKSLRDDQFLQVEEGDREREADEPAPLRILIDNLRSAFNVGAILRTAECFGTEEVLFSGYTPTPEDEKTSKTSLGAQDSVKWSQSSFDEALARAETDGYETVALETVAGAKDLNDFQWPEKTLLLLGNERFGLDDKALGRAKHFVRIPLFGKKNSLNVGIACGIALADWRRKLETQERTYKPVATFHTASTHRYETPRQGSINTSDQEGVIRLRAGHDFEQGLKDLAGFDRLWVVYDFHHNTNWKPLVRPPRGSHEKRGVFATRAPYRPNPIGLSCVELVRVEGRDVVVKGFDLLDGTPVLDIKPYLPYADSFASAKTGWLEGLDQEKFAITFSHRALGQLMWLESQGVDQLRGFLYSQLEFDPTDGDRKRVTQLDSAAEGDSRFRLAYRTWRADFRVIDKTVTVERFSSGYTEKELHDESDKYQDKSLHRSFIEEFK